MSQDLDELCGIPPFRREWIDSLIRNLSVTMKVEKVILFGSRSKGIHTTWSDYDVCIVSDGFQGAPMWKRMETVLEAWEGRRALEPLCYTSAEYRALGWTMRSVLEEGLVLFPRLDDDGTPRIDP